MADEMIRKLSGGSLSNLVILVIAVVIAIVASCQSGSDFGNATVTPVVEIEASSTSIPTTEETATSTPLEILPTPTLVESPTIPAIPTLPTCSNLDSDLLYLKPSSRGQSGEIYVEVRGVCANGSSYVLTTVIEAHSVAASPLGDVIAFGGNGIQLLELPSRNLKSLLDVIPQEYVIDLSWSNSGEYLAYVRFREKGRGYDIQPIEIIHVPTYTVSTAVVPEQYQDTLMQASIETVSWLPGDNGLLLFGSVNQSLFTTNIYCDQAAHLCSASDLRQIPTALGVSEPPTLSPDGRRIATVCVHVSANQAISKTLCLLDMAGTIQREFTMSQLGLNTINNLAWSPDGTRIAFDDTSYIYVLLLADGKVTRMDVNGEIPFWVKSK
jgi:WD40 repeat protein